MKLRNVSMTSMAIISMILGYVCGVLFGEPLVPFFDVIGKIFINLLTMICVPFVLFSITNGVASMSDLKKMGRVGGKICLLYVITTILGATIAWFFTDLFGPGRHLTMALDAVTDRTASARPTVTSTILNLVPPNIFASLTNMDLIQIIVFSIFFGVALVMLGEKKTPVVILLDTLTQALIKIMHIVMKTVPVGVFALMWTTGAAYGPKAIFPLLKVIGTEYFVFAFEVFVMFGVLLAFFAKLNILTFVQKSGEVIASTLSTTSSNATLPITISTGEEKMGIPSEIASFSLPLGATVNLNGAAAHMMVCIIFSAQAHGIHLDSGQIISLITIITVTAIGAAGVPGGSIAFTLAMLSQFGIPTAAYALILGIYRILDMGNTTVNVLGDLACTTAVCANENILDRSKWEKK